MQRRDFLHTSLGLLAVPTILSANETSKNVPKVALIGAGWYGKSNLLRLLQVRPPIAYRGGKKVNSREEAAAHFSHRYFEVSAIADVDAKMLNGAIELVKKRTAGQQNPTAYSDYRALLKRERPDIVIIATPDHWHALAAIEAIQRGAHVYLEKPVSLDVLEGEAILAAARQYDRVVQVNTQRRSTPHFVEIKQKIIDTGLLGTIGHVEMCCYYHMRDQRKNSPVKEVPEHFDYDAWAGPAPKIPFQVMPHRRWRARTEYSNGIMGDMCVHLLDTTRWLLDLGWPTKITSQGGVYVQKDTWANTADTQMATFEYPNFNCVWQHRSWGPATDPDYPWAIFIYGSKGTLKASVKKWEFIPNRKEGTVQSGEAVYEREDFPEDVTEEGMEIHVAPATRAHLRDFLAAIENKSRPVADIEQAHISTASCLLANISRDVGRSVIYDPERKVVVGDEEATKLLKREYRVGYRHPWR